MDSNISITHHVLVKLDNNRDLNYYKKLFNNGKYVWTNHDYECILKLTHARVQLIMNSIFNYYNSNELFKRIISYLVPSIMEIDALLLQILLSVLSATYLIYLYLLRRLSWMNRNLHLKLPLTQNFRRINKFGWFLCGEKYFPTSRICRGLMKSLLNNLLNIGTKYGLLLGE